MGSVPPPSPPRAAGGLHLGQGRTWGSWMRGPGAGAVVRGVSTLGRVGRAADPSGPPARAGQMHWALLSSRLEPACPGTLPPPTQVLAQRGSNENCGFGCKQLGSSPAFCAHLGARRGACGVRVLAPRAVQPSQARHPPSGWKGLSAPGLPHTLTPACSNTNLAHHTLPLTGHRKPGESLLCLMCSTRRGVEVASLDPARHHQSWGAPAGQRRGGWSGRVSGEAGVGCSVPEGVLSWPA